MQIRLHSTIRGQVGQHLVEVDLPAKASVQTALDAITTKIPVLRTLLFDDEGVLQPNIVIFRNGRNIEFLGGMDTPLEAEHALDIFPRTGAQRALIKE